MIIGLAEIPRSHSFSATWYFNLPFLISTNRSILVMWIDVYVCTYVVINVRWKNMHTKQENIEFEPSGWFHEFSHVEIDITRTLSTFLFISHSPRLTV